MDANGKKSGGGIQAPAEFVEWQPAVLGTMSHSAAGGHGSATCWCLLAAAFVGQLSAFPVPT
jgi:hypothetical protein